MSDNGLSDEDINGQVIVCLDESPNTVEIIVPLDTMSSASYAFSHAFNYFHNELNEDVEIAAVNVQYKEIDGVLSLDLFIYTRPFD